MNIINDIDKLILYTLWKNKNIYFSIDELLVIIYGYYKLEEIYFPNDSIPVLLSKKSSHLKLIQNIRNEAHRFAINYHKDLRSKNFLNSKLEEVKGVGESTRSKLINEFGSVENIIKQDVKKLSEVIGKKRAGDIINFFRKKPN